VTVNELIKHLDAEVLALTEGERKIESCYAGDLLSWVMGSAKAGSLWITIMTNVNVLAVASLHDFACVLITDNAETDENFIAKAKEQGINLLRTKISTYEACVAVGSVL